MCVYVHASMHACVKEVAIDQEIMRQTERLRKKKGRDCV